MKKFIILLIAIFLRTILCAQSALIEKIEYDIKLIDSDSTLKIKAFDANQIHGHTFDGGGVIKVHFDQKGIKRIEEEIGVSYGRLTTIIYVKEVHPIKIIDREENFAVRSDQAGFDYTSLNIVFQAEIYIIDWQSDYTQIQRKGSRNLSEGTCGLFEYEPLLELVREQMKK